MASEPGLRQLGSIALLLTSSILYASPCVAQSGPPNDLSAKLSTRVDGYQLAEGSFVGALCRVAGDFKIPMGITWVNVPVARQPLALSWNGSTVQEIIEAITQTQPDYRVQIDNGIVHVF